MWHRARPLWGIVAGPPEPQRVGPRRQVPGFLRDPPRFLHGPGKEQQGYLEHGPVAWARGKGPASRWIRYSTAYEGRGSRGWAQGHGRQDHCVRLAEERHGTHRTSGRSGVKLQIPTFLEKNVVRKNSARDRPRERPGGCPHGSVGHVDGRKGGGGHGRSGRTLAIPGAEPDKGYAFGGLCATDGAPRSRRTEAPDRTSSGRSRRRRARPLRCARTRCP